MKIALIGFGKMPADCLSVLIKESAPVSFVIENENSDFSPLKPLCVKANVPYYKIIDPKLIARQFESMSEHTTVLSINNGYIFPRHIVEKNNLNIVNFHGAILPGYRGHGSVIPTWVIFHGKTTHGFTWHRISTDLDAGEILCQSSFPVEYDDTAISLMMKVVKKGTQVFRQEWRTIVDPKYQGILLPKPQGQAYRRCDLPNEGYFSQDWDFGTARRFLLSMDSNPLNYLPKPKVIIDNTIFSIKNSFISNGQLPDEAEIGIVKFHYPDGTISLQLQTHG